jgi:site-specific recombinase XerD
MAAHVQAPSTVESVLEAFDDHLRRTRGLSPAVRHNYRRTARGFLEAVFGEGPVDAARLCSADVVAFVSSAACRYRPATVQLLATALRAFLRFLRAEGLRGDHLEEAVPKMPSRRLASVPRHLGSADFARLIASLDVSTPLDLRGRAIVLLVARLGLRASEVARLRLEDIDWRSGTVTIVSRKTGHGAVLPLPNDVGEALAAYLERGRPNSDARQVFVLHRQHLGAPINHSLVTHAVCRALAAAGIAAPVRGANLLRHSLATDLLAHGASLKEIADLFGHRVLSSTQIYAKVDIGSLAEAALPWPEARP